MVEDRMINSLSQEGYRRVNSNSDGIYYYYQIRNHEAFIVSVFHAASGSEFTVELYRHIIAQMKKNALSTGVNGVFLLSLIFTENPHQAKQFCMEEDQHWLIDLKQLQLIIYENQASDYMGLHDVLLQALEEERKQTEQWNNPNNPNDTNDTDMQNESLYAYKRGNPGRRRSSYPAQLFTPVNTIIIVLNIIVHIVVHYTGIFGGTVALLKAGDLSWMDVRGEGQYYRLLTCMFLHGDLGHLFNNMMVMLFVGDKLERSAGRMKYLFIYFGAGIIAGITSISYNMMQGNYISSIGASGAIFGLVGAMLYILLINRGQIENMNSRQMILFIIFGLYGGFANAGIDNAAHIGGFISGFVFAVILYRRPGEKRFAVR